MNELRNVCGRDHLRQRISPEELQDLSYNFEAVGVVVVELPKIDLSPDPKDNPILATAIAGNADLIVTGDKSHLQSLGQVQGIPIVTPRNALDVLRDHERSP